MTPCPEASHDPRPLTSRLVAPGTAQEAVMCVNMTGNMEVITVRNLRRRSIVVLILGLCTVGLLGSAGPFASAGGSPPAVTAAGAWSASLEGVHGVAPDATVRQIARVSVAGAGIRVRLGNPFGSSPVV